MFLFSVSFLLEYSFVNVRSPSGELHHDARTFGSFHLRDLLPPARFYHDRV
jgi:hypothetical protein